MTISQEDTILITGATGFAGSTLVRMLCQTGATVRAIARPTSDRQPLADLPIEWIIGSIHDEEVVKEAVKDVNYVFHIAGAFREARIKDSDYHDTNVVGTQLMATHASQQKTLKRYIHTSTIGVHGDIENPPADENYRFAPGDQYQRTKLEAELWIRDFASKVDLPLTVVRPCAMYGPGDERLLKVFKMAKLPIVPLLGVGQKHLLHLVHVEDLCDCMMQLSVNPAAVNEVFICGNEKPTSLQEILEIIRAELGLPARFIVLPVSPLFLAARFFEAVWPRLGWEPPLYKRRVAFYTKDRSFNTAKIHSVRTSPFKYDTREGLIQTLKWYQQKGWY